MTANDLTNAASGPTNAASDRADGPSDVASTRPPAGAGEPSGAGPALYVYAVLPAPAPLAPDRLGTGIDGAPLRLVELPDGVAALVHETSSGPYQGADDDARRWVLEHSAAVDRAWEVTGSALPMTFNMLVRADGEAGADQRLRGWLRANADRLRDRLDEVRDRVELRVDIAVDGERATADLPEVRALREELAGRPAGVARLLGRKLEMARRQAANALADRLYPEYRRRIAGLVDDIAEGRRGDREPGQVPVLAAAVLMHRDRVPDLGAELSRIQQEQPAARIRFLGPWPPYSFSDLPAGAPAGGGTPS